MSGFEWFLLVVVVIAVPLVVAVAVTLWTLEQARMRNRRNRETGGPAKRRATRDVATAVETELASQADLQGSTRDADTAAVTARGDVSRET